MNQPIRIHQPVSRGNLVTAVTQSLEDLADLI
jgi:hypothetical protein